MKHTLPAIFLSAILLSGCASSKKIVVEEKNFNVEYTDFANYKSVETRDNIYRQDTTLSLAVSISGGGSRASYFGRGVLLELENIKYHGNSDVLHEVDYLSTVSGGGHAGGAYIASLYEWDQRHNGPYSFNTFYKNESDDLLIKYKTNNIFALLQRFPTNRAHKLEKRVDDHVLLHENTGSSILLGDLFVNRFDNKPVKYPMLAASATNQQSKIQYPFSPDVLNKWQLTSYYHRKKYVSNKAMEQLPLAVALTASGTVPLMVPPTVFKYTIGKYMRFVDGGLADNTGVATALKMLEQTGHNRKKLLVIEDTPGGVEDSYSKRHARNRYQVTDLIWYGLDSKYFTFYQDIANATKDIFTLTGGRFNVDYDILDFRTLLRDPEFKPENLNQNAGKSVFGKDTTLNKNEVADYLLNKYETDGATILTEYDRKLLFEVISHIPTKYEATERERRILILAGRVVVRMQRDNILTLLN